jgi:hypothetical protein
MTLARGMASTTAEMVNYDPQNTYDIYLQNLESDIKQSNSGLWFSGIILP